MQDYAKWLKHDFLPHATGDYAIGAAAYQRMLADQEMVDIPLADLRNVGQDEMARLQAEFQKTAHTIDPNHNPAEVAATLNREHPSAEQLIPTVTAGLAELRDYVVAHHLATIPSDAPPPLVRETPPAMRATTFASMDTPGPFEKSTEAYFYVTLPEPSWPENRREQLLEFFRARSSPIPRRTRSIPATTCSFSTTASTRTRCARFIPRAPMPKDGRSTASR